MSKNKKILIDIIKRYLFLQYLVSSEIRDILLNRVQTRMQKEKHKFKL